MKLETRTFGMIDYVEEDIISFEHGLYGFEDEHEFLYVQSEDDQFQFNWLQSIKTPDLTFIVTIPYLFVEDYNFDIEDQVAETLKIEDPKKLTVMSIVNISEEVEKATINVKAPLLINVETKIGRQVILKEDYPYKYYIFEKGLNEKG